MLDRWFVHEDPCDDPIYVECLASSDPKAHYTLMLDKHPEVYTVPKGLAMLLSQLISWIPQPRDMHPFVLAHPDLDIQNFIVSEDGELQAIVDWDGVAAVHRSIGNKNTLYGSCVAGARQCTAISSPWTMGWNQKACGKIRPNGDASIAANGVKQ
ncbi:hypothetical protein BJX99DRAFT_219191 [Aspergillus californicus]